ncbi:carbohydrate kinase [Algoriphagus sp. D3-2-R+10]|uniref:carbohydrate kinase family protein n=1 Tax=Algoriphagus aurantiacus TaxID=3103948 RepID=UPI002B365AE8|nr:carbohydrate kinase [Algoriphagus sp. D3-2-R+10]MEB2773867.1 carbohydrate kinase [Algoriphagus sp. D3-2-R+10]
MTKKVICFGEMLWDCFPDCETAGGAPMNVALHLKQLGLEVQMVSRLGNDEYGSKLLGFVKSYGLKPDLIQEDLEHPTGMVMVDKANKENIKYDIVAPSAWDFICLTEENLQAVSEADALVFGSLAVRNELSWKTLYHLVQQPVLTIFDINLREPFIDFIKIESLLGYADILKINEDELAFLADYFEVKNVNGCKNHMDSVQVFCDFMVSQYPIEIICITLGSNGAMIYCQGEITKHDGYKIQVEDTLGSGDAFLSGFVKMYLEGKKPMEILDFSCKMGAYVATQQGGTPKYKLEEFIKSVE